VNSPVETAAPAPQKKRLFVMPDGTNYTVPFILVTSLFLLWGFCNGMIDVMDKHFQNTLHVNKAQSTMVQFANYMGYFLMALPAGMLARRFGYKRGIIIGLLLIATGALWFVPAIQINTFWAFLIGLFVLATGLTCLETIANPYTTVLGPTEGGPARINLAQSANGVGWILGPIVGGQFIFSATGAGSAEGGNSTLFIPYLGVAIVVAALAIVFWISHLPELHTEDDYHLDDAKTAGLPRQSIWTHPHFVLAVAAQFFYVAAQTGIFSFFINYIDSEIPALTPGMVELLPAKWVYLKDGANYVTELGASQMLSYGGFVLFLLGRFAGSAILRVCRAHLTLGFFCVVNALLMVLILAHAGWASVAALFLSFFFMSIMFPTIFALGIHGLGEQSKKASSFIVMAIVGGAIMPMLMGWIGDNWGMTAGFVMPLGCFLFVAFYSYAWPKLAKSDGVLGVSTVKGH
jgi:FHS family L-fucose permease-like MFS transporter